jgi:formate C-acetyltransferase
MPPDKAHFVPGAFCWVMHERLGSQCGATPDGRRAGTPFADGCGPAQGREACGPTAAVLSTTSWDHAPLIGGSAFNMKFNKSLFADQGGRERLGDLVLTFLRRGGFETQINVVDADRLLAAREHPEDYRDLVVRIGGYTDYFVRLSPGMQDEVIRRTQFATV